MRLIPVTILFGLAFLGAGCVWVPTQTPPPPPPANGATSTPTTTEAVDTSDWLTYTNEEYGFGFRYPSNLDLTVLVKDKKFSNENKLVSPMGQQSNCKKLYDEFDKVKTECYTDWHETVTLEGRKSDPSTSTMQWIVSYKDDKTNQIQSQQFSDTSAVYGPSCVLSGIQNIYLQDLGQWSTTTDHVLISCGTGDAGFGYETVYLYDIPSNSIQILYTCESGVDYISKPAGLIHSGQIIVETSYTNC